MKKNTLMAILLIILTATVTLTVLLPHVNATNVEITSLEPSTRHGKVGEEIHIVGTINTTDGLYLIWFGKDNVVNGTASQNEVDIKFPIPLLPTENYTITLQDYTTNNNATTWFYIDTAYYVVPDLPEEPKQLQEGTSVVLNVTVTAGQRNTIYCANITVELPEPVNTNFSAVVELTNTTDTGYGNLTIVYPNETIFQPSGSHTNYTGLYDVYFNRTDNLAENKFFIGLTNSSEYHREEFVEIRAVGYQPNENATVTITYSKTNTTLYSEPFNASLEGIINATWPVPWNASIGEYNVTIASQKPVNDTQLFSVPGYQIEVRTINLAGDIVQDILVEALDEAANTTFENASATNGLALFQLEKGNHTLKAFWKKVKVGEKANVTITGKGAHDLTCNLTNMRITVMDKDGILMPFINLNITFQYLTTKEAKLENESETAQTDISGVFLFNSTLPNINYTINASRYGMIFNVNNDTIGNLPAEPWYNVTILCPAKTLALNITEHYRTPLPNARVEMIEQLGGLHYSEITNDSGMAMIECTIGNYTVKIYKDNVLLNESFIDVFNDTYREIYCQLYNLTVSVRVVDYLGQPIPGRNVILQRESLTSRSSLTQSDGIATFGNVIGGNLQITVYLTGQAQPYVVKSFFVDQSTTIEIKLENYVMLLGFLVETGQFVVALIIAVAVVFLLSIEVYRRKRYKPQKSES